MGIGILISFTEEEIEVKISFAQGGRRNRYRNTDIFHKGGNRQIEVKIFIEEGKRNRDRNTNIFHKGGNKQIDVRISFTKEGKGNGDWNTDIFHKRGNIQRLK